jgi:hypothetical protein
MSGCQIKILTTDMHKDIILKNFDVNFAAYTPPLTPPLRKGGENAFLKLKVADATFSFKKANTPLPSREGGRGVG